MWYFHNRRYFCIHFQQCYHLSLNLISTGLVSTKHFSLFSPILMNFWMIGRWNCFYCIWKTNNMSTVKPALYLLTTFWVPKLCCEQNCYTAATVNLNSPLNFHCNFQEKYLNIHEVNGPENSATLKLIHHCSYLINSGSCWYTESSLCLGKDRPVLQTGETS